MFRTELQKTNTLGAGGRKTISAVNNGDFSGGAQKAKGDDGINLFLRRGARGLESP
jgi:hypothetical protein